MSRDYGILKESEGCAYRALFIINPEGVVEHESVNSLNVGRNSDEALRLLDGFIEVKTNNTRCPINWKKGAAPIVPAKAKEWFSQNAK